MILTIILRQSVTQHGSIIVSEIKIEWENYKKSTYDLQGNVISTIPLAKYLFRFQNFVDNFRGHPNRPTDLECTETLSSLDDIPTSGTNTMALRQLNQPLPI